jgi:2-methylcitrate dehydratase PrpD
MRTTIEQIADWATGLRFEDIPERVVAKAKLQLLSMVAAVYSGFPTRAARAIREVALGSRAHGRATVLPMGDRTSVTMAVMANAAASMALDYDDYLFMGHTGHSAVLASLANCEELGRTGADLLRAQIAANEASGRLGAAVMLGPQNGQLWTHIHALGSALSGALLQGLDAGACAHAMALALYQPPMAMWPGFMGPDSKLLSAAAPARDGLYAARMAAWGLTGPLDILDSERGFGAVFADQFLPQMLTGWGEQWVSDSLCYKVVPGCAYLDAALDALFETMDQFHQAHARALEPADVVRIEVGTTLLGYEMQRLADETGAGSFNPVRVNFSIPLSLAIAVRAGRLTPAELEEEALAKARDEIQALAARIEVRHDWNMTLKMISTMAAHLPLTSLLSEIDLRQILSTHTGPVRQHGLLADLKPRDLLRITAALWDRAPDLMRHASRKAADGLGRLVGSGPAEAPARFSLGLADFERLQMPFGAEVRLTVRGDQRFEAGVEIPRGAAGRDFAETKGLVRKKFREQAARLLREDQVRRAIALTDTLEQLADLDEFMAALTVGAD